MKKYQIMIVAAAVLWGLTGTFAKLLSAAGLTSMQCVAVRIGLAAVFYTVFLLFTDRAALKIRLRDLPYFLGTGLASLLFFNWCFFSAIRESSLAVAAVLLYTAPAFVLGMSAVFFRERFTRRNGLALLLTLLGCVLVTGVVGGDPISLAAFLYGIGSGFGYALYSIIGKFALRKYSPKTVTVYTFLIAGAAAIPISRVWEAAPLLFHPAAAAEGVGLAVLCCIAPYLLYTAGLEKTPPGQASILATIEPVTAAAVGTLLFHEPLTAAKIAGIALVIGAIVLIGAGEKKHAEKS